MGILDQLRKTAHQKLEQLGVTLNIPDVDVPDDEDTRSRDFVEIYKDIVERASKLKTAPVPEAFCHALREIAEPFCAEQQALLSSVDLWIEDRRNMMPDIDAMVSLTKEDAVTELYAVLAKLNLLIAIAETPDAWLKAVQTIAQTQERHVYNLLIQASHQVEADSFDAWKDEMNDRLAPFGIKIVTVNGMIGIV